MAVHPRASEELTELVAMNPNAMADARRKLHLKVKAEKGRHEEGDFLWIGIVCHPSTCSRD